MSLLKVTDLVVSYGGIEALKGIATSSNQKLLMLPMDTTNVAGSLAGIAEVAKEILKPETKKK